MTVLARWRAYSAICIALLAAIQVDKTWAAAQEVYIYREQTGDLQVDYTWRMEQRDDLFVISSIQPEKQFQTVCTADGATLSWTLQKSNGENLTARREKNSIHISGTIDGKATDQKIAIDARPWFQPLSFSLRSIATGTKAEEDFWIIRPDNFKVVALKAEKKECTAFEIYEKKDAICEVEIKKSGWLAPFWRASYWFRQSDGLFIKYRSVHGLPGTNETIIQLIQNTRDK